MNPTIAHTVNIFSLNMAMFWYPTFHVWLSRKDYEERKTSICNLNFKVCQWSVFLPSVLPINADLCLWKNRMMNQTVQRTTPMNSHIWNAHGIRGRLSRTISGRGGYIFMSEKKNINIWSLLVHCNCLSINQQSYQLNQLDKSQINEINADRVLYRALEP